MWRDMGEAAVTTLAALGRQWLLVLAQWACIGLVLAAEQIWRLSGMVEWVAALPCTALAVWMAIRMIHTADREHARYRQAR